MKRLCDICASPLGGVRVKRCPWHTMSIKALRARLGDAETLIAMLQRDVRRIRQHLRRIDRDQRER